VTSDFLSGCRLAFGPGDEDFVIAHVDQDGAEGDITKIGLDGLVGPLPGGDRTAYYAAVEAGLCDTVPAYAWVNYASADQGIYDLVFYLFRPFNGPTAVDEVLQFITYEGQHEGDWETVAVRIQALPADDYAIVAVNYSAHGFEGGWYSPMSPRKIDQNAFEGNGDPGRRQAFNQIDGTDHPLVYAALASHANYTTPEDFGRRPGGFAPFGRDTAVDALDDGGARWQTWKNMVLVNPEGPMLYATDTWSILDVPDGMRIYEDTPSNVLTAPVAAQEWLNFNGRWGNWLLFDAFIGETSLGPRSPAARDRTYSHEDGSWTILKPLKGGGTTAQRPVLASFDGNLYQLFTGDDILVSRASDGVDWQAPARRERGRAGLPGAKRRRCNGIGIHHGHPGRL
jgi:hypothetical protein